MNTYTAHWSDGEPFQLAVGQRWQDPACLDDIVRIDKIEGGEVTYTMEGLLTLPHMKDHAQTTGPIEGTDGFTDFLESNCYKLI